MMVEWVKFVTMKNMVFIVFVDVVVMTEFQKLEEFLQQVLY